MLETRDFHLILNISSCESECSSSHPDCLSRKRLHMRNGGTSCVHSLLLVVSLFWFGVGFFFGGPDINLGLTTPITIISHQQHGESEKRN